VFSWATVTALFASNFAALAERSPDTAMQIRHLGDAIERMELAEPSTSEDEGLLRVLRKSAKVK
jgi:hypothetical protein